MNDKVPELDQTHPFTSETGFDLFVEGQNDARQRRDLLIARCGSVRFGLFSDEAEGLSGWSRLTPLPHSPKAILGVTTGRGRVLTVLDPIELLGEVDEPSFSRALIVGLRGDEQLALAVERVERITEIVLEDVVPSASSGPEPLIYGQIALGEDSIRILNVSEIFDAAAKGADRRRRRS